MLRAPLTALSVPSPEGPVTEEEVRFVKVAAGLHHFAAVTAHGVLYTWGRGGSLGAGSPLGHGDSKDRSRPTLVGQFVDTEEFVVDVACGAASTCVVTSSGRVFSSGAADFGLNGSGMLVSSKVFKELEFFRGVLSSGFLEAQRRNEEGQLQQLEALRKNWDQQGGSPSYLPKKPFEAAQNSTLETPLGSSAASNCTGHLPADTRERLPSVFCGVFHCGLLTPEGCLWMWGRNNRMQLSKEKSVMASGGESNYPLLAEFFTRSDVQLEGCALGPFHSLAVARNGMVYEWGGERAEAPHAVDMHWRYPGSIFKGRVTKVAAGGDSSATAFSAVLTEKGEIFFWGPGASLLPLGQDAAEYRTPVRANSFLPCMNNEQQKVPGGIRVVDFAAGPRGCLLLTAESPKKL
ncbi:E3 ubiquitin-protein ligase HERC2 [Cyclospora cayetanensis]|uniref:E3 ubiquitin-protein ligase HERC2 n=1 Tax=Cyclospora cayetanensis TaxID=88456 RepID=A0A6P6RXG9_9EIME|nr:E3 ubiquitin-protein ligase HERC2 [Cyclospora cayetanensis]